MASASAAVRPRNRELESLEGLSAIDAIARLRALELRPAVEACESGPEDHGLVLAHEPPACAGVRRGQLVTLLVGERQPGEDASIPTAARAGANCGGPRREAGRAVRTLPRPAEMRPLAPPPAALGELGVEEPEAAEEVPCERLWLPQAEPVGPDPAAPAAPIQPALPPAPGPDVRVDGAALPVEPPVTCNRPPDAGSAGRRRRRARTRPLAALAAATAVFTGASLSLAAIPLFRAKHPARLHLTVASSRGAPAAARRAHAAVAPPRGGGAVPRHSRTATSAPASSPAPPAAKHPVRSPALAAPSAPATSPAPAARVAPPAAPPAPPVSQPAPVSPAGPLPGPPPSH
jgi:hypothetical protein